MWRDIIAELTFKNHSVMQYWVHIDGLQRGPMTLDELIGLGVTRETYVWRAGLKDWIQAKDLSELSGYFNIPEAQDENTAVEKTDVQPDAVRRDNEEIRTIDSDESKSNEQQSAIEDSIADEENGDKDDVAKDVEKEDAGTPEKRTVELKKTPEEINAEKTGQTVPPPVPGIGVTPQNDNWQPIPECPPTNLVWAILATVLCCQILGIVAIIYAAQVESKYRLGQYDLARKYSDRAAIWCMVSFAAGLVYVPVALIVALL